ncbi:hypothetical protein [Corynebacterium sp. MSK150]|uniref:hypothetical protein n=1 Tax=Corynebacterium sp. MSK150 TaxID=3050209 RepID=UPI00254A9D1D|nr:hypothetical protein [Corynebacterium sp. MSK150]MDK8525516.1 hypothetical protein [Corynebacterium sp. MSK150]
MAKILVVDELEKSDAGLVSMRIKSDSFDEMLWFQLPDGFVPHSDQVAVAVGAIFGNQFSEVNFNEPLTESVVSKLSAVTGAKWNVPRYISEAPDSGSGEGVALSFSGGFDSLAALSLLGDSARLVSIDFGTGFERERKYYSKFETAIIETNAREFESSWTFMGLGVILLREYFEADYFSFGSIFEASPWHFLRRKDPIREHPIFQAAGLKAINPVMGLTEFATAKVAATQFPDTIVDSLCSLASVRSEKFYRKLLMLDLVQESAGIEIARGSIPEPGWKNHLELGQAFAADFLSPGMTKFLGEPASSWIDVPVAFKKKFESLTLDFYWRENPELVADAPPSISKLLAGRKAELGITPYKSTDWDELREVISFMNLFHTFPGPTF